MNKKKTPYLTNERLAAALEDSLRRGYPTVEVCECFKLISSHLLGDSRFRSYPPELQEDMTSAALEKCIKNIKNYRPERATTCFSYFTRATECAFFGVLGKHYKHMNTVRKLTRQYAEQLEQINTKEAQRIKDSLLSEDTTNTLTTTEESEIEL